MERYVYIGPVMIFDRCVEDRYKGETYASSEKKARSNIAYGWKKLNGLEPTAKVSLPGNIYISN